MSRVLGVGSSRSFNPSIGILVVQTNTLLVKGESLRLFQSLNRDSGCSDWPVGSGEHRPTRVSIPQSGFWLFRPPQNPRSPDAPPQFQSLNRDSGCSDIFLQQWWSEHGAVSIPQSGFWLFRLFIFLPRGAYFLAFQSLNRDSGCSDPCHFAPLGRGVPFQSLNRDSGCSDLTASDQWGGCIQFQSLNRDSGCSDLATKLVEYNRLAVSIPQSGFWLFRLIPYGAMDWVLVGFNPSIGILVVQTAPRGRRPLARRRFQSLNRDSGCSD